MMIADLHIHSKYSMATSGQCDLPHLDLWARMKGIGLVGTGDCTHPAWRRELGHMLEPAGEGLYRLRGQYALPCPVAGEPPLFAVTGEIGTVYRQGGRTRKVHHLIVLPGLEAAAALAGRLEAVGNIHGDGRPVLGMSSRDLAATVVDGCARALIIPAHIWTPHYAALGALTGFDSLDECYGDMAAQVRCAETGLSADPAMISRVPALDGLQLLSNSDAHSPSKLGREATIFSCAGSYPALYRAIATGDGLSGTIEFFPQEGKYYLDGHKQCGVCLDPGAARALGGLCPACGRQLTRGVLGRVDQLSGRAEGAPAKPFWHLMPLPELLGDVLGASPAGKKVGALYLRMLAQLGSEFFILRQAPLQDVALAAGQAVADGLHRLRRGLVTVRPGYDGVFGKVRVSPEAPKCAGPPSAGSPGPAGGGRR